MCKLWDREQEATVPLSGRRIKVFLLLKSINSLPTWVYVDICFTYKQRLANKFTNKIKDLNNYLLT